MGHHPDREGPQEWWFPVRAYRSGHLPPLRDCLLGHLPHQQQCQEACTARVCGDSLSILGYLGRPPFIKNMRSSPTMTISAI